MKKMLQIFLCLVLMVGFLSACSSEKTVSKESVQCLDSINKEYVIDQIDPEYQFILSENKNDIQMTTLDGQTVTIQVEENAIVPPEGGYQTETIYILRLNESKLEEEALKDAKVLYFTPDKIENKSIRLEDVQVADTFSIYDGYVNIGEIKGVFVNEELKIHKEVNQFDSIELKVDGQSYPCSDGKIQAENFQEGTYEVEFSLEYDQKPNTIIKNCNFKGVSLLERYGKEELLKIGQNKFENEWSMLYGIVNGAIFEPDPNSSIKNKNGLEYGLSTDSNLHTVQGFENYYYSIYSRRYPMVNINMIQKDGKVYFPTAGVGGIFPVMTVVDVIDSTKDEVWYSVKIEVPVQVEGEYFEYGQFSLVLENGQWKYGAFSDIDVLEYIDYYS